MRLFEDTLFGDEEVRFDDPRAEGDLRLGRQYLCECRGCPVGWRVVLTDAATFMRRR